VSEPAARPLVGYDVVDHVARITLQRPEYRNAQSRVLLDQLDDAFERAAVDHGVHVVALFGAGDHFSAGHDLGTPDEQADQERRPWRRGIRGWYETTYQLFFENTLRWRNLPKPTVAAVQGYCIFGGWMIASAMDVIVAADDAMFLGSHFQYFAMPWDLSPRKAKELLFEPRFLDAAEAEREGLVNRVVPRARLEQDVLEWAGRVAANDPFQLRMTKLAVNQAQDAAGYTTHLTSAHALYVLGRLGERDPDSLVVEPGGRRRPMVQRALENWELRRRDGR
jgi:enoyl-CoA hydratase